MMADQSIEARLALMANTMREASEELFEVIAELEEKVEDEQPTTTTP